MSTYTLSSAPAEVGALYDAALRKAVDGGSPRDVAERKALRHVQHAGWFRTNKGWRKLAPDLRDRVNVRDAVAQPDGTYLVEDVDVFYANAVKGKPEQTYDANAVTSLIRNTNRSIEAGAQRPGVIEGHPHPLQAAAGTQLDSHGAAVNFRGSPRGKGWVRCDLVDVKPEVIDRLKARKLTGLSAGIVEDAGKLNRRFGHVAMLGGSSQALSLLPAVEIFSAHNQVCFSAETPTDASPKGSPMPRSEKQKAAFSALSAAYAACAADETGSEDKMKEARSMYTAAFEGESDAPAMPEESPTATASTGAMASEGSEGGPPDFVADPAGAFEAVRSDLANTRQQMVAQERLVKALQLQNAGLIGQKVRNDFSAAVADLKRDGHQLPTDEAIGSMFETCFSTAEPQKAVASYIAMLRATPKRDNLASLGTIFGTEGQAAAPKNTQDKAGLYDILNDMNATGFSADDMKLGEIVLKGMAAN